MKRALGLSALLLLSACASSGNKNLAADRINQEMDAAVAAPVAAKPEAVDQALLPPLAVPNAQADDKPTETKFDLSVNSTPAKQVFTAIVSGTRYSVLVNPEVSGNISLTLKDVTVFDALEAIREIYGYDYKVDGARIYIQPLTLQTRMYQVNYLTGQRDGRSSVRVASGSVADVVQSSSSGGQQSADTQTNRDSARITTTSSSDFWDDLIKALTAIVGSEKGRSVVVSPMSGVIVVRAMPDELRNVATYLKAAQISVDRQVILEAKIVEVQLNESFQSGVNWAIFKNGANSGLSSGQLSNGSSLSTLGGAVSNEILSSTPGTNLVATAANALPTGAAAGTLFGLAFQTSNFAALLNFLETQGDVHVLSSPRIATLNNQKAVLKVGTDEFFVTKVTGGSVTGASGTTSATFTAPTVETTAFFSGIMLDVTPKIDENNEIVLHVHPSVSKVGTVNKTISLGSTFGNFNLPVPSSTISETDSVVRARDGQIVAIGGLMRQAETNDDSGLPVLPKSVFGQTSKVTEKRELIILLKPTVVDSDSDWSDDIARSRDRMSKMSR
ncbi:MAG: secretin N-terminal domain-containing protein [Nitrosomonadales bacterium]|nr:secretin N-terminal domain-containing protein [Nitrosomonadales bacterium]